ncbi:capsid protein 1 [Mink bocavirus 1]|uniref:Minor capsid protein VP1 n=2 Tax=Mink bocavirus 1 TaxID=2259808 RepID=A0A1B3IIH5_9VIRU|nr:capsid protein 1 [Mink bocavirus 1]AOF39990.1 capsid protein 1 [Mink bocavirus 1]
MPPHNRKPGGWVLPGFKYLGPFNPLNNGEPVNDVDKAAQAHDQEYQKLIDSGINPYFNFNKADSDFIENLSRDNSFAGWLGKSAFRLKSILAPHLPNDGAGPSPAKRGRFDAERAAKRKLYFARSNRKGGAAKKPRLDPMEGPSDQIEGGGDGPEQKTASTSNGGGGGGSGGHGVGVSTGGWEGGCYFADNVVVTKNTRQWYAPIYNGHKDTRNDGMAGRQWKGINTPWGYFNFNIYDAHFSPQDWQRLTNEYRRWRPKSMFVKIYNLQIKQVVTLGADTLYNNDLTAGVHFFCDGSHQFPYSQHPWDTGTMPELPNRIWKLPQYAYFTHQGDLVNAQENTGITNATNQEKMIAASYPTYILEHATHQVLRTGEETSFQFNFECGWVNNDTAYAIPQADFNPLVPTRRYFPVHSSQSNTFGYVRYSPYNKPSIWMPGPSLGYVGYTESGSNSHYARGPITVVTQPPGTESERASLRTGENADETPQSRTVGVPGAPIDTPEGRNAVRATGYDISPVNGARSGLDAITLAYDAGPESASTDAITARNNDRDMARWGNMYAIDHYTTSGNTTTTNMAELKNVWMFPNQAWDSTPITRNTPIWVKIPRTDKHTLFDSSDGTLPMAHPPGTIFCKVAKIPIPTENNTDSYLNLYVTGQVTCQIVWETERYQSKNLRPELRTSAGEFRDQTLYTFDANGTYNSPERYHEGMPTKQGINKVL